MSFLQVPSPDEQQFMLYNTWMKRNNARKRKPATTTTTTTPTTTSTTTPTTPLEMEINVGDVLEVETLSPKSDDVAYDVDANGPSSAPTQDEHSEASSGSGPNDEVDMDEDTVLPLTTPSAATTTPDGARRRRSLLVDEYEYEWETKRPYQALQEGQSDPFFTILGAPTIHLQYRGPRGKVPVSHHSNGAHHPGGHC